MEEASVWQGIYGQEYDARGDLFARLLVKASKHEFDDEYLGLSVEYGKASPQPERFHVFYAWYALAHGNYEVALAEAEQAAAIRAVNGVVWKILVTCYVHFGRYLEAAWYQGLLVKFYQASMTIPVPAEQQDAFLARMSIGMGFSGYAPIVSRRIYLDGKRETYEKLSIFLGEPIEEQRPGGDLLYWSGVYGGCQGALNHRGEALAEVREQPGFVSNTAADLDFELIRSTVQRSYEFDPQDSTYILPLAGTEKSQRLDVYASALKKPAWLGKYAFSFYRVSEPVKLCSEQDFALGRPIRLGHSSKRRKLVLHIMVDGLCWQEMREENYRLVPHIIEFFRRGVIFGQHFSVSEYTYPSFPSIETGLYPHHHQIFNEQAALGLALEHKTLAEQMRTLGYHTVNIQGGGDSVYNSVGRGYDRRLIAGDIMPAAEGVERTIQQIEAFDECDQFIFLCIMDTHPWDVREYQVAVAAQTHLEMKERLEGMDEKQASVRLQCTPFYMTANRTGIKNTDRSLGTLFDYLTEHFTEDEYLVELCSDHGVSIYDEEPYVLSDKHTGAALMLRGAGVPQLGFVDDELTSTLDIYPIMSKLCDFALPEGLDGNLPAAFGGKKREYCISNTMFPKQTYKMRLRLEGCQMDLESKTEMYQDGTVDLTGAHLRANRRDGRLGEVTESELSRMLEIVREHTASLDNRGIQWPMLQDEV